MDALATPPKPAVMHISPLPERAAVRHFVEVFYAAVREDAVLGPVFARIIADADWEHHFEVMTDFWSAVAFDGPSFRGNPMIKHAMIRDIKAEHFKRWLEIFEPVARACWSTEIADLLIFRAHQLAPALLRGVSVARDKGLVDVNALH